MRICFENLYSIKNKMDNVRNRKIPSALTMVHNDTSMNDRKILLRSYFKKITKDVIPSKMNNGSVIPKVEFKMILGSKAKNAEPTNAIFSSKNFLHKK